MVIPGCSVASCDARRSNNTFPLALEISKCGTCIEHKDDAHNIQITGKKTDELLLSAALFVRKSGAIYEVDGDLTLQPAIASPALGTLRLEEVSLDDGRMETTLHMIIAGENITLQSTLQILEPLHFSIPGLEA